MNYLKLNLLYSKQIFTKSIVVCIVADKIRACICISSFWNVCSLSNNKHYYGYVNHNN